MARGDGRLLRRLRRMIVWRSWSASFACVVTAWNDTRQELRLDGLNQPMGLDTHADLLHQILTVVREGRMPPDEVAGPTAAQRSRIISLLDKRLALAR